MHFRTILQALLFKAVVIGVICTVVLSFPFLMMFSVLLWPVDLVCLFAEVSVCCLKITFCPTIVGYKLSLIMRAS